MFDKTDPRSILKTKNDKNSNTDSVATPVKIVKFYEENPSLTSTGTKTWWSRGQNFYLSYSEALDGQAFTRDNQVDEYVVILPDESTEAIIKVGNEETAVTGYSLVVVPPGESEIKLIKGGRVIQLFTVLNEDLLELPSNKAAYEKADPNVAPFQKWPDSPEGFKVRAYSLDVPKEEGRFGRIFRNSTFMVNFLDTNDGPRDATKLSPHSHEDFEQCSLIIKGEFVHHLRWPWIPNKEKWQPDQHELCGAPSMTVIPPGVIHTTEAVGEGLNQMIDIFCPPRLDFSKLEGWVLNDKDYPID